MSWLKAERGLVENRYLFAAEEFVERPGRPAGPVGDDYDPTAIKKSTP